jgi:hypothetical protein
MQLKARGKRRKTEMTENGEEKGEEQPNQLGEGMA